LKYKDKVDFTLLKDLIIQYQPVKEFFIQKAIGWSLRQYTRVEPELVKEFVEEIQLSGLARREALRLL
jgi:3-methyladenine DNA glycosylase AlkD